MLANASKYADKFDKFDGRDWGEGMHYMWGYGYPPVGVLLHLVTWVLVIMVLVALFRWLWRKGDGRAR